MCPHSVLWPQVALIASILLGFTTNICPPVWDTITLCEVTISEGLISPGKFPAASSVLLATWEWGMSSSNPEALTEQAGSRHTGKEGGATVNPGSELFRVHRGPYSSEKRPHPSHITLSNAWNGHRSARYVTWMPLRDSLPQSVEVNDSLCLGFCQFLRLVLS